MSLKVFFPPLREIWRIKSSKAGDLSVFIPECHWYVQLFLSVHFTFLNQMPINLQHLSRTTGGFLTWCGVLSGALTRVDRNKSFSAVTKKVNPLSGSFFLPFFFFRKFLKRWGPCKVDNNYYDYFWKLCVWVRAHAIVSESKAAVFLGKEYGPKSNCSVLLS